VDGIRRLIHEIHRRSVWQVLGIFLAASWVVLQVVEVLTETAGLPDWTPTMALVLLLIGLPICVATAFVQEGMPGRDGVRGDAETPEGDSAIVPGEPSATTAVTRQPVGESLPAPQGTRRLLTWRNAVFGGIGAFALLGFSLIAYFVMWTTGIGPVGNLVAQGVIEERDPIILAEFENRTTDETLGAVVTDALRVDLLESQVVTLVDDASLDETLRRMGREPGTALTSAVAREIAIREGIKAVIEGDVSTVGSGYVLSVEIVAPSGGPALGAFRETAGSDAELLPAIDRLSQKLREKAGESLRDIRAGEPLEEVTTSSLDALRLFVQAEEVSDRGDEEGSIRLLEEAVALDSTFAMAWRKLAVVHGNIGRDNDAMVRAASAAWRHRDRLTERERYLAEAYYHNVVTLDTEARADAYRRVLEIQPDDPTALNNLAVHYGSREEWARARDLYVRAIEGPGRTRNAFNNLVIALFNLGEPEAAMATLDQAEELYPTDPDLQSRRIRLLWAEGRHDEAVEVARRILASFPDDAITQLNLRSQIASIEWSRGRLDAAREAQQARRAMASSLGRSLDEFYAEMALAGLDLVVARDSVAIVRRVERRFEEILADVPERNRPNGDMAVMWGGMARDPERAQFWADRALATFPPEARGSAFYEELQLTIEGYLALVRGDFETTIEDLQEVRRRQNDCTTCYLPAFADAWRGLEQPDSAIVNLERFFAVRIFDFVDDQESEAATRLRQLARLYEQVGRNGDAAAIWTRFADRWAEADDVLQPQVRAARAEAERLARSGG
jgi:tetratricopeptide (TPR) repeat protein